MISKEQALDRLNKIKIILSEIKTSTSIKEISIKTGIPTSTIKRYLKNTSLLQECGLTKSDLENINTWLNNSKRAGLSRGRKNSQEKYTYDRDKDGHYNGIKR